MSDTTNIHRVHISIAFGDAILPVIECDDGHQRVPLKPIADQVGVQWAGQRRKIENDEYLTRRLGAKVETSRCLSKPQLCIRINKVESFLNTLSPKMISSKGNTDTARWLEDKHNEWDEAIHLYDKNGFVSKDQVNSDKKYTHLYRLDKMKNGEIKRIYAEQINKDYDLAIPIGNQGTLEL
jgi:hypothetical protein